MGHPLPESAIRGKLLAAFWGDESPVMLISTDYLQQEQTYMIDKTYNPTEVEKRWYPFWIEKGYFHADEHSKKPPFTIVIPPPNVTGKLHMGHALFVTIQDLLTRFKRMQGFEALWLPGTDHAGIATQVMVERQLAKEGKTRLEIGREAFLERVYGRQGGKCISSCSSSRWCKTNN